MKRRDLGTKLFLLMLLGAASAAVHGCGVLNPSLVSTLTLGTQGGTIEAKGNVVILVMNTSSVTTQANIRVTRDDGGQVTLNIAVPAFGHRTFTQECEVQQIEFVEASFADVDGAVQIPFSVSPLVSGVNLDCGDVVAITMIGNPPNVAPQVAVY